MAIKPYLQLIRLPNVFTAAADSLAGWILVTGNLEQPERWVPLVGASMATYAAGIALNDVFDYETDLKERPARPLPSGRVSRRFATILGTVMILLGPALAAFSGSAVSFAVALALGGCVLGYDLGLKRTLLGPEIMGACRGLNLLLGMSQAPALGGPGGWLVAVSLTLFVAGITWISRSETETGVSRGLYLGLILENLGLLGLVVAALQPRLFPNTSTVGPRSLPLEGLLVLLLVAWVVNLAGSRALREPIPARLQRAVKTGVLSLVWLNVGMVMAVRSPSLGLLVALTWIPAFLLGKWLYST